MTTDEFLNKVAGALDTPAALKMGQRLDEIEGWDSLGILSILDLLEQAGVTVQIDALRDAQTTDDLIRIAGLIIE